MYADLIQKHRAVIGGFENAHAIAIGAGERSLERAEQLAFEQRGRDGSAVHRHERLARARAVAVNHARHQFLAGPVSPSISTVASVGATREAVL